MAENAPTADELLAHTEWLTRLARALVGDAAAGDVVQDTYEVALAKPPKRHGALRPWLGGVARNVARMATRGRVRRERREDAVPCTTTCHRPRSSSHARADAAARRPAGPRAARAAALDPAAALLRGHGAAEIARAQASRPRPCDRGSRTRSIAFARRSMRSTRRPPRVGGAARTTSVARPRHRRDCRRMIVKHQRQDSDRRCRRPPCSSSVRASPGSGVEAARGRNRRRGEADNAGTPAPKPADRRRAGRVRARAADHPRRRSEGHAAPRGPGDRRARRAGRPRDGRDRREPADASSRPRPTARSCSRA